MATASTRRTDRVAVVDPPQRRPLGTPNEVSKYLGITTGALAQMRYLGQGPVFQRLGAKTIRYAWEDVDAWLDARKFRQTGTSPLAPTTR